MQEHGRVDTHLVEQLPTLRRARQRRRGLHGIDHAERVTIEGDDGRHESLLLRRAFEVRDDGTVADVHAVELADGHGARPEAVGHVGEVVVVLHGGPYSPTRAVVDGSVRSAVDAVAAVRWCLRSHHSPAIGSTSGAKRYPRP